MGWTPENKKLPMNELLTHAHDRKTWKRLNDTHVLVIDEISMIDRFHLERINLFMKEARRNEQPFDNVKPFGGVQLIVTGDVSTSA